MENYKWGCIEADKQRSVLNMGACAREGGNLAGSSGFVVAAGSACVGIGGYTGIVNHTAVMYLYLATESIRH
jgi:hypothetical protein